MASSNPTVIHQGVKSFWKTRSTVDLTLARHCQRNTIEIIAFEPALDVEGQRIYVDETAIAKKLNADLINENFEIKRETLLRRKEEYDPLQLMKDVQEQVLVEYIVNRIFISQYLPQSKSFGVEYRCDFHHVCTPECHCDHCELVNCSAPVDLIPHMSRNLACIR